jgi:soluble lytic murein transglycosylase
MHFLRSFFLKTGTFFFLNLLVSLSIYISDLPKVDPTDDFSMVLAHSPTLDIDQVLNSYQMQRVFQDRLKLPVSDLERFSRYVMQLCRFYRFDPAFLLALIDVESRFCSDAISSARAVGLMQMIPETAYFVARYLILPNGLHARERKQFLKAYFQGESFSVKLLKDPFLNVVFGMTYLAWLTDRYRGVPQYILGAYNIGPGKMDSLLKRISFHPEQTKMYYQAIRHKIPEYRFYPSQRSI